MASAHVLRPAGPHDTQFLAWGLDEAAGGLFTTMFGARSGAILATVVAQPEHAYSFQHATVAEVDGQERGFCQGWPYGTPAGDGALMRAGRIRSIRAAAVSILGRPALAALDRHAPGEWYLQAIAVHPAARGHGIGQALFAEAVTRARSAGCTTLTLDVDAANVRARSLYERLGLLVVSVSPRALLPGGTRVQRMSALLSDLSTAGSAVDGA
jgi:ribosomal protein S18 acetylase RimI-like enzyme